MIEVEKLNVSKDNILSTIRSRGPSLPVQIAREIQFSPLFASAFLSELKAEGKIKLSNMRVGSSPLYFLPGQEDMLEKFVPYLNQREKEAFQLLKASLVLEDSKQSPVMRVALRAIKDFAVPVKIRIDGESRLFWKHFSLSDEEVAGRISGREEISEKKEVAEEIVEEKPEVVEEAKEEAREEIKEVRNELKEDERPLAEKMQAKVADNAFPILVKDYLSRKDIEILHIVSEKKKEFEAKIRINTDFGKQNYYLVAKDKKNVSDADLVRADELARAEKLPAVFMSSGDLNKKGRAHLELWGNLARFEKLDD